MIDSTHIAELVELGEAEAYADLFAAAPPAWGWRVERFDSSLALIAPSIDTLLFNRVLGLGVLETANEAHLTEVLTLYRQAGVRSWGVQLSPIAQPPQLQDWLQAHGLQRADHWAKVYRAAAKPIDMDTDLRIEAVGPESAADFARVVCVTFGMPLLLQPWLENLVGRVNWQTYLAFADDRPAACGALFMRGEVGWLGIEGTLPDYRRRGGQSAIMACGIRDAARLGCRWIVTETGEDLPTRPNPSFHNMLRAGFTLAYQRPNYLAMS